MIISMNQPSVKAFRASKLVCFAGVTDTSNDRYDVLVPFEAVELAHNQMTEAATPAKPIKKGDTKNG